MKEFTFLMILLLWGCSSKNERSIVCIEGLATAENVANCEIAAYLKYKSNKKDFKKRLLSAHELYQKGENNFNNGRYGRAHVYYSNSRIRLPSYKAMARTGDAIFYMHTMVNSQAKDDTATSDKMCSRYFIRETELQLFQTYDAALLFHAFEEKELGIHTDPRDVEKTRKKSACLKTLAAKYKDTLDACVDRALIKQCLD